MTDNAFHSFDPPPPPTPERKQAERNMSIRWLFGAAGLVLGLVIAGVSGSGEPQPVAGPTVTKTVAERVVVTETVAPDVTAPEPDPAPSADAGVVAFGKTWVWEDGLQVKVSAPVAYRPSSTAIGGEGYKQRVVFTVTVTNKTGDRLDPVLTTDLSSKGREGDQIFDSAKDIGGGPDASLRDGKSVTFKIAYGVDDLKDIELQVSPDFRHDPAIFSTSP